MADLRTDIQDLYLLRSLRERATTLRNQAAAALAHPDVDHALEETRPAEKPSWISMQSLLEAALLVKVERLAESRIPSASTRKTRETRFRAETRNLELGPRPMAIGEATQTHELFPAAGDEIDRPMDRRIPVMLAAFSLQVLASRSTTALSKESMLFYYRVLFEFYVASRPDWTVGAARSGDGGNASAFVTNECIKAILTFEQGFHLLVQYLDRTRDLCGQYRAVQAIFKSVGIDTVGSPVREHPVTVWAEGAIQRMWLDWYIATAKARRSSAFHFDRAVSARTTLAEVGEFVDNLPEMVGSAMKTAAKDIREARDKIRDYNKVVYGVTTIDDVAESGSGQTQADEPNRPRRRENAASVRAMGVIETALKEAEKGATTCDTETDPVVLLEELSKQFSQVARDVHRVLDPSKRYVEAVLDRELSQSSTDGTDAGELAFAAASFGAITGWKQGKNRLQKACGVLAEAIPPSGILSSRRPFHSTARGYKLFPTGCEITRSVALLFQQTAFEFSGNVLRRIIDGLEEKAIVVDEGQRIGWNFEGATDFERPSIWVTAVTVLALQRMVLMLDGRINAVVFRHFNVILPEKMHPDLTLNGLIYPDYGFGAYFDRPAPKASLGLHLEEMRAHLAGVSLGNTRDATHALFSAVLYGPPGTGKTTLAEALALSSGVPLVTLSPFDLKTEDQPIEGRTRLVFEALSMLTHVVVLFDEFEEVLMDRAGPGRERDPNTRFLLTGLLPQLARLHEIAQRQAVVYFMATNQLSTVDSAAIRRGRFDEWLPVYHPDPLSRAGTFLFRLQRFALRLPKHETRVLNIDEVIRLLEAVEKCRWLPTSSLAEVLFHLPKWVTSPDLPLPADANDIDPFEELIRTSEVDFVEAHSLERPPDAPSAQIPVTRIAKDQQEEQAWLKGVEKELATLLPRARELGRTRSITPAVALKMCLDASPRE